MPQPFKNVFNPKMIRLMAHHLANADTGFDAKRFVDFSLNGLSGLELKERSNHILAGLEATLPHDFITAGTLMRNALEPENPSSELSIEMGQAGIRDLAIMPMADYVAKHGIDHWDFSMDLLKAFTKRFSAEFAIRPFLDAQPQRALTVLMQWTKDPNVHVRRLASEGSRPRLPWGMRLKQFDEDPRPLLPILERLKDDKEAYVRRSVANSLNDIAKAHPDLVANLATKWLQGADLTRKRLIKHACRSLIKQGHPATLEALGYAAPELTIKNFLLKTPNVLFGEHLSFELQLRSIGSKVQPLVIDYIIHHKKANGSKSPKVFKWKTVELYPNSALTLNKMHPFKPVTTRSYYAGQHLLELQINGRSFGKIEFQLKV